MDESCACPLGCRLRNVFKSAVEVGCRADWTYGAGRPHRPGRRVVGPDVRVTRAAPAAGRGHGYHPHDGEATACLTVINLLAHRLAPGRAFP
ncbi:MAG: hypothetical protein JWO31_1461 [Phycisphaerales bacterium]|nr:hypothetical protein [Phycisphaerales bacterium]